MFRLLAPFLLMAHLTFAGSWFFVKTANTDLQFSNTQSCLFDGSNDLIDYNNVYDNDGTTPMTWAFWAKSSGFDNNEGAEVFSKNDASGTWAGYGIGFYLTGGVTYFNTYISANISSDYIGLQKGGIWVADTWQHWAVTYDGSKNRSGIKRYLNGSLIGTETNQGNASMTGSSSTSASMNIGSRNDLGSGVWNYKGKLAQPIIMSGTELNATEVAELHNGGVVLDLNDFSRKADVDSWYQCTTALSPADDPTGTIYDRKGSTNGTTANTAAGFIDSDNPPSFEDDFWLALDGTGDYAEAADNDELEINYNTPFTINMWIYKTGGALSGLPMLFAKQESSGASRIGPGAYLSDSGGAAVEFILMSTATTRLYVSARGLTINNNTKYMVTISSDGTGTAAGTKIYWNGSSQTLTVSQDNLGTNATTNSGVFTIGGSFNAWGAEFQGKIGDFSRFDVQLSNAEVTELYNAGATLDNRVHSQVANLISPYYIMGDFLGSGTISSITGTAHNLTLNGNAAISTAP